MALTACVVTVSAPVGYQLKQPVVQLATDCGAFTLVTETPAQNEREGRVFRCYGTNRFNSGEAPMLSVADRNGALYYQYGGHTRRFPAGTGFETAFPVLRAWVLSGPQAGRIRARRGWLSRVTRGRMGGGGTVPEAASHRVIDPAQRRWTKRDGQARPR